MGFWDYVKTGLNMVVPGSLAVPGLGSPDISGAFGIGGGDPANPDRDALRQLAEQQGRFGRQGMANYGQDRLLQGETQNFFRGQMMGQNSLANETLRQGLQQGLAAQQSMAASANPQDQAMAARNAALNMGRMTSGLAGQQALAHIQEGAEGARNLAQMQLGQSGQDLQAGLGAYGLTNSAYGTALGNPQKTWGNMLGGAIGGLSAGAGAMIGK